MAADAIAPTGIAPALMRRISGLTDRGVAGCRMHRYREPGSVWITYGKVRTVRSTLEATRIELAGPELESVRTLEFDEVEECVCLVALGVGPNRHVTRTQARRRPTPKGCPTPA